MPGTTSIESVKLEDFRQGAEQAFEMLFRLHQKHVYQWIVRIVRDPSVAEDLTIETFLRIYRAHARFDPDRAFEPWARRIATHVALDWLRTRPSQELAQSDLLADLPAPATTDPAMTAEIRGKVVAALSRLPTKLRVPVLLALVEERPQKEIAQALGISLAAVKLRIFRALRRLRTDLQQQGITP